MKHLKILAILAIFTAGSVFAQAPSAAGAQATAKSTATQARDAVREAKDAVDEAKAAIALERNSIAVAQKAIPDLALADRLAAQKEVNERTAAVIIAEKRLAQVSDQCTAAVVSKKVVTQKQQSSSHAQAAAKAQQLATATATATAAASAGNASASATATVAPQATAAQPVTGQVAAGGEVCRLRSDGSARLLSDQKVVLSRGHVIAIEKFDNASPQATVIARNSGEDCNAWRARVDSQLVDHKSH